MGHWNSAANELFVQAIEIESRDHRRSFIEAACGNDAGLRTDVERLLKAHNDAGSFLEHPVDGIAPTIVTGQSETVDDSEGKISLDFLIPGGNSKCLGTLGFYEVIEVVGRGGMGVVLRAHDPKLNRMVAIKVIAPELAANAMAVKRFLREAVAAAAVSHDHVVTIHAIDEGNRPPFIVMEYVAGESLQQRIDREGALGLQEILRIGMQIAAGLAAAHQRGLVHRDIKPANILVESGIERVKITDFGLARAVDDLGITQAGQIAGTPQYMSPEQAQGQAVDSRTDLFSLGSAMYAMCGGRPAFCADNSVAVLRCVCDEAPRPLHELNSEIPEWLESVVFKLLEKDPANRIQTADEVSELLRQHLAHLQQPTTSPQPKPVVRQSQPMARKELVQRRWSLFTAAAALSTFVMLAAGVMFLIRLPNGTVRIDIDDPQTTVEIAGTTIAVQNQGEPISITPGEHKLSVRRGELSFETEKFEVGRDERITIRVQLVDNKLAAMLDGKLLGEQSLLPLETHAENRITLVRSFEGHSGPVKQVAFSPDGKLALSASGWPNGDGTIILWDVATGTEIRTLGFLGKSAFAVHFSPDGKLAAGSGIDPVVHIWDVTTGKEFASYKTNTELVEDLAFSPDGRYVLSIGHKRQAVSPNLEQGMAELWDLEIGKSLWSMTTNGYLKTGEFLEDGNQIVVAGFQTGAAMHLLDRATGRELKQFKARDGELGDIEELAVSPDGQLIATASKLGHVCIWQIDKSNQPVLRRKLTDVDLKVEAHAALKSNQTRDSLLTVAFSPDGRWLLTGGYAARLYILDTTDLQTVTSIEHPAGTVWNVACSADGRMALTAGGTDYAEIMPKRNGDYALRLWRLPQTIWSQAVGPVSARPPDQR